MSLQTSTNDWSWAKKNYSLKEKIEAVESRNGPQKAAKELLHRLQRRADWLPDLITALLSPEIGLEDFGKKIESKCSK